MLEKYWWLFLVDYSPNSWAQGLTNISVLEFTSITSHSSKYIQIRQKHSLLDKLHWHPLIYKAITFQTMNMHQTLWITVHWHKYITENTRFMYVTHFNKKSELTRFKFNNYLKLSILGVIPWHHISAHPITYKQKRVENNIPLYMTVYPSHKHISLVFQIQIFYLVNL